MLVRRRRERTPVDTPPGSVIADAVVTRRAIERHRALADRGGRLFTILRFRMNDPAKAAAALNAVAGVLTGRIRLTDELGWLDSETLLALLPDTCRRGATSLLGDIRSRLKPEHLQHLDIAILEYPPDRDLDDDDDQDRSHDHDNGHPQPDRGDRRPTRPHAERRGAMVVSFDDVVSEPLEVTLVRQLPRWKRTLDVAVASIGLVALAPVFAIIAALIKFSSNGPVLFVQTRRGLGGRPFRIYKFRTMVVDAEAKQADLRGLSEQDGAAFKMKRDPRVTPVGVWLRRLSLDELPQLINVLKKDMTLVGPRPLPVHEADACSAWQRRRLEVTPGLTCIWQVQGRSRVSFDDWVRMDLDYIRRLGVRTDLGILLQTPVALVWRSGV